MNKQAIKKEDVNRAVFHLLRLKGDAYSLDLSLEKANEMGISEGDFKSVLAEIELTNEFIREAKKEPNHELVLHDPQKLDTGSLQQTMPSGSLSSNGQEQVGTGFFAPSGTMKVRFSCRGGGALTPAFICRTHSFGVTNSKTEIGTFLTWKDIDVDLAASNINVSIDFRTTDSNGGLCNWKGML